MSDPLGSRGDRNRAVSVAGQLVGAVPEIDPVAWRLQVHGAVDRELELSLDTLRDALPEREVAATLQCAATGGLA
jgi:DMSO/TMAO reductase YedYZ molybdopterin-dependent catalytic subunit